MVKVRQQSNHKFEPITPLSWYDSSEKCQSSLTSYHLGHASVSYSPGWLSRCRSMYYRVIANVMSDLQLTFVAAGQYTFSHTTPLRMQGWVVWVDERWSVSVSTWLHTVLTLLLCQATSPTKQEHFLLLLLSGCSLVLTKFLQPSLIGPFSIIGPMHLPTTPMPWVWCVGGGAYGSWEWPHSHCDADDLDQCSSPCGVRRPRCSCHWSQPTLCQPSRLSRRHQSTKDLPHLPTWTLRHPLHVDQTTRPVSQHGCQPPVKNRRSLKNSLNYCSINC